MIFLRENKRKKDKPRSRVEEKIYYYDGFNLQLYHSYVFRDHHREALLLQLEYCYCQFKKSFLLFYGFLDFSHSLPHFTANFREIVIENEKQLRRERAKTCILLHSTCDISIYEIRA